MPETKMRLHLWYLSEDLAALPLFSDDISVVDKEAIVNACREIQTMKMFAVSHQARFLSSGTYQWRSLSRVFLSTYSSRFLCHRSSVESSTGVLFRSSTAVTT
jgi:hypothetical protein